MQAVVDRHADALFKASHAAAFGVRVQALALLLQLLTAQSAASDRFYRCAAPCCGHQLHLLECCMHETRG